MMSDLKSGVDYSTIISNYSEKLGASFFKAVDANGIQLGASAYDSNGQVIYTATTFDHFATDGYLTANGTVRGIIMIVLLGISAAAFIASGVIGYIRAKRLHNYLNSKGQNN